MKQDGTGLVLSGETPNAGRQLLPEAGATQERTLAAVACTPWLGLARLKGTDLAAGLHAPGTPTPSRH